MDLTFQRHRRRQRSESNSSYLICALHGQTSHHTLSVLDLVSGKIRQEHQESRLNAPVVTPSAVSPHRQLMITLADKWFLLEVRTLSDLQVAHRMMVMGVVIR